MNLPSEHFADRLLRSCRTKAAPICVGIDPVYERLPESLRAAIGAGDLAHGRVEAISRFCELVLESVAAHVPCVKIQSACFERYRSPGVACYHRLIDRAQKLGLLVIADAKRGDIGVSADHYAAGCLAPSPYGDQPDLRGPDALTVNAYLGPNDLGPFLETAQRHGKGLFALVRTSNAAGDAIQSLPLADGRTVAQAVAQLIAEAAADSRYVASCGYSLLGAVVGATKAEDAALLRALMPQQIFLVPGFGAQGGGAQDVRACFKPDGTGALITASRSILYAYEKSDTVNWIDCIQEAVVEMKQQVVAVLQ